LFHDKSNAYGGSKVEDPVASGHEVSHETFIEDGAFDEFQSAAAAPFREVRLAASAEVIEHDDPFARLKQPVSHMRSNETGSACYQ